MMKYPFLFSLASLESPSRSDSAETVVKILHIYPVPKVLEIWRSAALQYEKANPAVKIEFDYLENEEFKAKLSTLLQSYDRPSLFHSWGGGVMREQIQAGVCQDITNVGKFIETLQHRDGQPLEFNGLWALLFFNRQLYLTARIVDEADGLFGFLHPFGKDTDD